MAGTAPRANGAKIIPTWEFHDRLRKARQTTGLDQKAFAERLGVTAGSYAGWEAARSRPRDQVTVARRIELLTSIPAAWILGLYEETPRPDGPGEGLSNDLVRPKGFEPLTFWSVVRPTVTRQNRVAPIGSPRRRPPRPRLVPAA